MSKDKVVFTQTVAVKVDPQALWENTFGTAGESFPWWREVTFLEGDWDTIGRVRLGIEDPDDETKTITREVGIDDLYEAVQVVLRLGLRDACTGTRISVDFESDDWDACVSDVILQTLVLREVVYG